jgi:Lon protease-like protein
VLFPNVFLPLHIFEPRYREMIADVLKSDRLIAMVLIQPKWEASYEGPAADLSDRVQRRHHPRRAP